MVGSAKVLKRLVLMMRLLLPQNSCGFGFLVSTLKSTEESFDAVA
jgi:hypothetical protein